jgi:hypothetical protein
MGVSSFPKDFVVPKGRELRDVDSRLGSNRRKFEILQDTSRRGSFCSGGETGSFGCGYKDFFRTGGRGGGSYTDRGEMIREKSMFSADVWIARNFGSLIVGCFHLSSQRYTIEFFQGPNFRVPSRIFKVSVDAL